MPLHYLYCAIRAEDRPELGGWQGEGAPLEVLVAGDVAGIVGRVPASRYGERALARALSDVQAMAPYAVAHQAVVQHVFERAAAVVPLAFGSVHRRRQDALAALRAEAPRLRQALARVSDAQEWGLRVRWRPSVASVDPARPGAGRAYLDARRATLRQRTPPPEALGLAESLGRRLARMSRAHESARAPSGDLVLSAAYLVPCPKAERLKGTLLRSAEELGRHDLVAELSGPWPAYSFSR